ncbi:MAG: 7-carboxy-7-deazaguanine synthase, partial [Actinomycetota bacterium]
MRLIPVSEIFGPTIQGEGELVGRPTVFVRTGGCDYRCSWCDTMYAVLPKYRSDWTRMSTDAVLGAVNALSRGPILVTLSGGNPAMHELGALIARGHEEGFTFAVETQGSLAPAWFSDVDFLTLSPKGPSSGEDTNWERLDHCVASAGPSTTTTLKVVVIDDDDLIYARRVRDRFPDLPFYLQVGNPAPDAADTDALMASFRRLAEQLAQRGWYDMRLLPQLHVLAWGSERC